MGEVLGSIPSVPPIFSRFFVASLGLFCHLEFGPLRLTVFGYHEYKTSPDYRADPQNFSRHNNHDY